jgi:predicted RNA-binding protein with PUA-like domain
MRMTLLRKGSRLSVQPVTALEWAVIMKLAQSKKQ